MKKNMFSGVFDKMVANFVPQEDTEARLTVQGTVVVSTNTPNGKEWVDKDGNIYMEDLLIDFPVFTIAKQAKDVKVDDIVKLTKNTFATVTEIKDGKIETITFGGYHKEAKAFKDILLGQATVRVVVNPMGNMINGNDANNNNLMMLALLDKESDDRNDFVKTIMLSSMLSGAGQNPFGNIFNNPLYVSMLMKGDSSSIQDIMLMQALQGGLGNMFVANNNQQ